MVTDSKVNDFLENLADALEISLDSLSKDAQLNSINWDSLAVISCIALADEHFWGNVIRRRTSQSNYCARHN